MRDIHVEISYQLPKKKIVSSTSMWRIFMWKYKSPKKKITEQNKLPKFCTICSSQGCNSTISSFGDGFNWYISIYSQVKQTTYLTFINLCAKGINLNLPCVKTIHCFSYSSTRKLKKQEKIHCLSLIVQESKKTRRKKSFIVLHMKEKGGTGPLLIHRSLQCASASTWWIFRVVTFC